MNEGRVAHITDISQRDIKEQRDAINTLLKRVTQGAVKVTHVLHTPNGARFVLSTNSLDFKSAIEAAVPRELRRPYYVVSSDTEGHVPNPRALSDDHVGGHPTLVILKVSMYKPATKTWAMTLQLGSLVCAIVFLVFILVRLTTME